MIDFHSHFFSRPFFTALAQLSPQPGTPDEKLARVSLDFSDWAWADPYVRCLRNDDPQGLQGLQQSYLEAATAYLAWSDAAAHEVLGHAVTQVLLLHANIATAQTLDAMLTAFLSTRPRGAAVLIGIPREDAVLPLPALSIPRMERRVLGSLYGSSRPERDFVTILDLYRRGLLPLDRLIAHRLPLDEIGRAFELLRSGEALRVVLDLAPAGAAA